MGLAQASWPAAAAATSSSPHRASIAEWAQRDERPPPCLPLLARLLSYPFSTRPRGHMPTPTGHDSSPHESDSDETPAASILLAGRYDLQERLGAGGMAEVWLA